MSVVVAIIVAMSLTAAGFGIGMWRVGGAIARRADRLGVGSIRGGLVIRRFRIPVLGWSLLVGLIGVLLGVAWADHRVVTVALVIGAALGVVQAAMMPALAPALAGRVARGVRRRVGGRRTGRRGRR